MLAAVTNRVCGWGIGGKNRSSFLAILTKRTASHPRRDFSLLVLNPFILPLFEITKKISPSKVNEVLLFYNAI